MKERINKYEQKNKKQEVNPVETSNVKIGTVVKCARLNVRKEASDDSDVIKIVDSGTEFNINITDSQNGFYKTDDGFVMAKYIELK